VKISDGGNCVSAVTAELLRLRLLVAAVDLWACRSAAANCCFLAAAAIASRTHSLHGLTRTHTASRRPPSHHLKLFVCRLPL